MMSQPLNGGRALRIGLVCPYSWNSPGGVRSHIEDLALALIQRGHWVNVLAPVESPEQELPDWLTDAGVPVAVPYNGSVAKLRFGIRAMARVRKWIDVNDFDVLHVHEPLAPSVSLLACWVASGPIVATWHSSAERSRVLNASFYIAQTALEKISARIAVSESARRYLVSHVGGDAILIPNGVRVQAIAERARRTSKEPDALAFLGRIDEPRKGLEILLAAMPAVIRSVPDVHLTVVGPGDASAQIARMDTDIGQHVTFAGKLSDDQKIEALARAQVYVAPHTGGESFGIVLAEAMAAGTAVLASDLEAFSVVLQEGRAGQLFPTGDSQALANAIVALLNGPDRVQELAGAGRLRVRDFDWDTVVDQVLAVYEAVTVNGDKVTEDLRGQLVGRWMASR